MTTTEIDHLLAGILHDSETRKQRHLSTAFAKKLWGDYLDRFSFDSVNLVREWRVVKFLDEVRRFRGQRLAKIFPDRDLAGAEFVRCDFRQTDMSGFDLREADFSQSNLIGAKFSESRADGGSFAFARCIWSFGKMASLKGSDLKNADFSGAVLAGCDFSGCNLSRAKLRAVNAVGADFSGTTLTGCDFTGADLSGAVFENAHLEGTNFSFANLEGCTFAPVDFTGGNFYKVHYDGVEPRDWPESTPPRDERVEVASIRSLERYRDNRYLLAMRLALFSHLQAT